MATGSTVWLSGLQALPNEEPGKFLSRIWGRSRHLWLPAEDDLDVAGRLLGFGGRLPAAALLAESEGIRTRGYWVWALEPVIFQGGAGRAILAPVSSCPGTEAELALFHVAQQELEGGPWHLARGRERWYLLSTEHPDLRTAPPVSLYGREPLGREPRGLDASRYSALANRLQMALLAHSINQAREREGLDPWGLFWPWGEGRLPETPPATPWQTIHSRRRELLAAGLWLNIPVLGDRPAAGAERLLWDYASPWHLPDTAANFATWFRHWTGRQTEEIRLLTGLLPQGGVECALWRPHYAWRFWCASLRPGSRNARPGNWA